MSIKFPMEGYNDMPIDCLSPPSSAQEKKERPVKVKLRFSNYRKLGGRLLEELNFRSSRGGEPV